MCFCVYVWQGRYGVGVCVAWALWYQCVRLYVYRDRRDLAKCTLKNIWAMKWWCCKVSAELRSA